MQNGYKKVFLAANGANGFVSYFKDSFDAREGWRAYILKGGAGTGKSTFMKRVAEAAKKAGFEPVLCYCGSDPDSLDAVIIKEKKTVLLDGTLPHAAEPEYYGVCEQIINLGEALDCDKLRENSREIISLFDKNRFYHRTAARYLSAYGQLMADNIKLARRSMNVKKINACIKSLTARYIKPKKAGNCGKRVNRFLSGITPEGVVCFEETVKSHSETVIVIEDKYGAAASDIMQGIITVSLLSGYETIIFKNPFLPEEIIDHIMIPELSLAFVCENEYTKFDIPVRKIHSRRFYDADALRKVRGRMFFNRRIGKSLVLSAVLNLKNAKEIHDKIENHYKNAADFGIINKKTTDFIRNELHLEE